MGCGASAASQKSDSKQNGKPDRDASSPRTGGAGSSSHAPDVDFVLPSAVAESAEEEDIPAEIDDAHIIDAHLLGSPRPVDRADVPTWHFDKGGGAWRSYPHKETAELDRYWLWYQSSMSTGGTEKRYVKLRLMHNEAVVDLQAMTCRVGNYRPKKLLRVLDKDLKFITVDQLGPPVDMMAAAQPDWKWEKGQNDFHSYPLAEAYELDRYFRAYCQAKTRGDDLLCLAKVRLMRKDAQVNFLTMSCSVGDGRPKNLKREVNSSWLSNRYFFDTFAQALKASGVTVETKPEDIFDFRFNQDFLTMKDDGRKMSRGGQDYLLPFGWKRFAVNVKGEYDDGDNGWLREDENGWAVAYHGTSGQALPNILAAGFRVGPRQKFADTTGAGIYTTPNIDIAQHYSAPKRRDGHSCQIVLQLRVRPSAIKPITDPSVDWMERQYWVINNPDDIRAYGVLLRELDEKDHVSPLQRAMNDRAKGIR